MNETNWENGILLVAGAAGSGKSSFVSQLQNEIKKVEIDGFDLNGFADWNYIGGRDIDPADPELLPNTIVHYDIVSMKEQNNHDNFRAITSQLNGAACISLITSPEVLRTRLENRFETITEREKHLSALQNNEGHDQRKERLLVYRYQTQEILLFYRQSQYLQKVYSEWFSLIHEAPITRHLILGTGPDLPANKQELEYTVVNSNADLNKSENRSLQALCEISERMFDENRYQVICGTEK